MNFLVKVNLNCTVQMRGKTWQGCTQKEQEEVILNEIEEIFRQNLTSFSTIEFVAMEAFISPESIKIQMEVEIGG